MKRSTKLANLIALLVLAPLFWVQPAAAAELVMVEEQGCFWCARWNEEIGVVYHKTDEGKRAPLHRVEIDSLPSEMSFAKSLHYTPTFVLMDAGVEVGRIEGHPGEDFFWPLLNRLLEKLPAAEAATN